MPGSDPESESDARQWLSGVALDLYEHLEATGQVARLKQIAQLGAVAWVHPDIKHTRWDYVELLLRLSTCVDRMPDLFQDIGEGDLEIDGHPVGTPCELLQCWAMLQNIGHIWGTFATERLVLNALSVPGRARDLFMEGMTTEVDRAFGEYVLVSYLLFKVNWALANGFLHALPEHQGAAGRQRWLAMLRAYRGPETCEEDVLRVYLAQRRLRRLAFVHLDLANAELPVVMDLTAAERDPVQHLGAFLSRPNSALNTLLEHVQQYIPSEIYYASEVVLVHRLLEERAGAKVARELNAAESPQDLFARLEAMKTEKAWPVVEDVVQAVERGDYLHLCRISNRRPASVTRDEWNAELRRLQLRFEERVGKDTLVHVNVPGDRSWRWTDFYVGTEIEPDSLARALCVNCEEKARESSPATISAGPEPDSSDESSRFVRSLLSLMLDETMRIRLKEYPDLAVERSFVFVHRSSDEALWRRIERLLRERDEGARRHEIEVLAALLRARPAEDYRIVMLSGFQVERKAAASPGEAEFDGGYIDVSPDRATLHLVEAKSTLDSPAAARQLRRRLRRLGWLEGAQVVAVAGGAEATVPIRLRKRRSSP